MASFGKVIKHGSIYCLSQFSCGVTRKIITPHHINRHFAGTYEGEGKTHAVVLNKDFGAPLMVDSYSEVGFRLNNGLYVVGPVALFPNSVLNWDVGGLADMNEEAFSLFWLLEPRVDVLVVGFGDQGEVRSPAVTKVKNLLRKHRIQMEVLPTDSACGVFNFLNSEGRFVGAALVPPKSIVGGGEVVDDLTENRSFAAPPGMFVLK